MTGRVIWPKGRGRIRKLRILPEAWNTEWRQISPLHVHPWACGPSSDGHAPPTASSVGATAVFLNTPLMSRRVPLQEAVNIHLFITNMTLLYTIHTHTPVIFLLGLVALMRARPGHARDLLQPDRLTRVQTQHLQMGMGGLLHSLRRSFCHYGA